MGFLLSCALRGKELLIFPLISLLVEACAGDIASIPDHFQVPDSFVIAFCHCWCRASRTKGGAKKQNKNKPTATTAAPFNLPPLLLVTSPSELFPAAVFFSHSQLFPFCLHAAFICFPPWCDVLIKKDGNAVCLPKNLIQSTDLAFEVRC